MGGVRKAWPWRPHLPVNKRRGDTKAEAERRASGRYWELPPQNGILFFNRQQKERRGEVTGEQMGGDQEEGADGYGVLLGVCVLRGWLVVEPLVLLK